jgi:hypothetical protein
LVSISDYPSKPLCGMGGGGVNRGGRGKMDTRLTGRYSNYGKIANLPYPGVG